MTNHSVDIQATAHATATCDVSVKRGEKSWQILLVLLGFALTIEGSAYLHVG